MKNLESRTELYHKALKSMPIQFTSHKFLNKLRRAGIKEDEIEKDHHSFFLLNSSDRLNKFSWKKKAETNQIAMEVEAAEVAPKATITIAEMIDILKANGYKVLKQEWSEL